MSWNASDNKKYRGKIDRIYIAGSETYEVEYYIDHYLRKRRYDLTDANRNIVAQKMEKFPGKAPIKRDDMDAFLDNGWPNR